MSATTQNNMTMINDMFKSFMERAVNDGPLSEYDSSILDITKQLADYWFEDENQAIFSEVLGSIKTKTTRKSKKSDDDTPKPRRPKSAYIFFCKDKREEIKTKMTEDGDKPKPTEVMRGLGAAWRQLKESGDNDLLSKYEDLAATDKAECHVENGTVPGETKTKKKKDDGKPKRAKSAYLFFCQDKREEIKAKLHDEMGVDAQPKEVTRRLGLEWNQIKMTKSFTKIAEDAYEKYNALATADKERYKAETTDTETDDAPSAKDDDNDMKDDDETDDAPSAKDDDDDMKDDDETDDAPSAKDDDDDDDDDDAVDPAEACDDGDDVLDTLSKLTKSSTKPSTTKSSTKPSTTKPSTTKSSTKPSTTKPSTTKSSTEPADETHKRPKVRMTGYALFSKENRDEVKQELIDEQKPHSAGDVSKALSAMWKELDEDEQADYQARAKEMNNAR
jgi:hypothetical protein